jgi:hypothetical protein
MRYQEFNLTEDELFELKMSPTNLKKMAAETGAVAGIEFEMYVPGAAEADEDYYDSEHDYEMDESFPTGRGWRQEVIDFFRGGDGGSPRSTIQRALDSLDEDYWSWKDENFEEWLNDNDTLLDNYLRQELPQDPDESDDDYLERLGGDDEEALQARERAMEQMREEHQGEDQFDEFLRDNDIGSMADFGSAYNVDWPYYTYPESNSGGSVDINDVASNFQSAIGRRVESGGYHSGASSQTDNYRVEPDGSLHDPESPEDGGLEFISPPLPLNEMLSDLEKVVKWAARNDCYTNSSTGLHMNISVPNFELSKLDYVKLAIFLGDEYVLDQFGRAGNTYCASAMEKIRTIARTNPDKVKTMLQQMQGSLSAMASKIVHTGTTSKYTSINTKDGYVEFRSPGGDWLGEYAVDPGKITNTLLRFTVALDIATKPELYRQEYMKKLYKTLSQGESDDTIQFFARYAAGDLPQSALKSFVRQAQLQRKIKKQGPEEKELEQPSTPGGGFSRAPHTSIYQVVNNRDGQIILGGETRTFAYTVEQANIGIRSYGIAPEDIRIIDMYTNRSYNIDGSPADTSAAQTASHPEGRGRPHDPNGRYAIVSREDPAAYQTGRGTEPEYQFRFNMSNPAEQHNGRYILAAWAARNTVDPANYMIVDTEQWDRPADVPGSTNDLARQRAEQRFTVDYTIRQYGDVMNNRVTVPAANADAAMDNVRNQLEASRAEVLRIEAEPIEQAQARGTESLPPGNVRWLILDRNDQEVYSFINTTAQSDANQYARQWLTANAQDGQGPYDVVPVSR